MYGVNKFSDLTPEEFQSKSPGIAVAFPSYMYMKEPHCKSHVILGYRNISQRAW